MGKKAKQKAEDPYARITREHFEQKRKQQQRHLIEQLKRLLWFFEETFVREASARDPKRQNWPFVWPVERDLAEFDEIVFGLAYTLRKKAMSHAHACLLVNQHWPSLRLDRFFLRLMARVEALPIPPLPSNSAIEHFEWIFQLAESSTGESENAAEFLTMHGRLRKGKIGFSQVKRWTRFRDVLKGPCNSALRLENHLISLKTDSPIECYAKYLELDRGLFLWERANTRWDVECKLRKPLYQWMEKNAARDSQLATQSAQVKKDAARKRKRRERRCKKWAQICVTDDLPPSLSLADLPAPNLVTRKKAQHRL